MFLRRLTLDEIEHGWRALHAEEASHQSAECTSTYLYALGCWQFYLLTEQRKIDTDDYQSHTQDPPQYVVFNAGQSKDGYCRYNNKRQQYRPKSFPSDIASHSPHDDSRGGNGQKSRESCGLAVCRQEERQHRHDEDANDNTVKERVFENVPVTRNQITRYTGSFFGSGGSGQTSDGTFRLTADPDWDSVNGYTF